MKEKEIIKPLPQGTTLHGKSSTYVIERPLGQGSFGTTYLATAKMKGPLGIVDVKVAIKEFFMREVNGRSGSTVTGGTDKGLFENYRRRFRREAENLASLQHPHIIKVLEMFEENNTCYYVMEYIDGGSLDEYIASAGRLPEIEARGYAGQLCEALLYMHQHNMLHLDVKPANIMRRSNGSLVLIDFGLSKQYNEDGEPESSSSIGKGSPGYAPIEQENYNPEDGDKNKKVKAPLPVTIDVYALGASIYKMLVGKRPPDASMILNGGFPRAALEKCSVSEVVIDVVAKAMAPIVKDRYPAMEELYYAITEGTRPEDDKKDKDPKPEGKNKGMEQQGKYKELTPIDIAKPSGGSVLTRWIKAHLKMTIIVAAALVSIAGVWIGLTQHAKTLYSKAEGYYDKKEYAEAVVWYQKAAKLGNDSAQYRLAGCYANGWGVEQDYAEAVKWLRKAAKQGNAAAQYHLGVRYDNGEGVEQDYAEAVKWYRKSAEQGNAVAQLNLGYCYTNGEGVEQDYAEAVKWYRKAAEQGNAWAQHNLGCCYKKGHGVPQDYAEAVKWYRKSAEQGNAGAQTSLGVCYYYGEGVPQDYVEAAKWLRKPAEQGDAIAQLNLGICYMDGHGVPQDYAEAVKWYRKAAEQGEAIAQNNLGSCYKYGQGVPQDYAEAVKWYRKAAEQGEAYAQSNLGSCYEYGQGVPQDYAEAVKWYRKAAEQGNADAKERLQSSTITKWLAAH